MKSSGEVAEYSDLQLLKRSKKISTQVQFYEGNAENTVFSGKERFQINTFLPVIDALKESLERRAKSYNDIFARFEFLSAPKGMTRDDIQQRCDFLVCHYASDFSKDELVSECLHFKEYLTVTIKPVTVLFTCYIGALLATSWMPSSQTCLSHSEFFLTLMVTNCSAERSCFFLNSKELTMICEIL